MTNIGWGKLASLEGYGRYDGSTEEFEDISFEQSSELTAYRHAAHAMLYCKKEHVLWDLYTQKAIVLMQMRFDGYLGFSGGLIDADDPSTVAGLNRELKEEININLDKHLMTQSDHVCSHVHHRKKLVVHFYSKEMSEADIVQVERNVIYAQDWGVETMGTIRVPLFSMGDGKRGFPAFMNQHFVGNARGQLLAALVKTGIFTEQELTELLSHSNDDVN